MHLLTLPLILSLHLPLLTLFLYSLLHIGSTLTPLGILPPASALSRLTVFPAGTASTATLATAASTMLSSWTGTPLASLQPNPQPAPAEGTVILSSALPPIGAKLANKIRSHQFVAMKELLSDNMALHGQLDDLPAQATITSRPHRLREIDSPLTWVSCFLAYLAVRTRDPETRDMMTYARLIIREAQCHSGPGWQEYDKWFRQQQAALAVPQPWHELNASLHAATVMSLRSGNNQPCRLCREPDHSEIHCALASLQPPHAAANFVLTTSSAATRRTTRPETLERICLSWNKGRCAFPGSCRFRHVCATCRRKGHRAKECDETPADSPYKAISPSPGASKVASESQSRQ